jgi:hypothetical protein
MAKGFEVPVRMSDAWLEENCPRLNQGQARDLIAALSAKGWRYRKGSLQDRVYERLNPRVRAKMETERG